MSDRNIAVVGCGYWGKNLVRNFSELGALHTICDIDSARLASLQSLYPEVKTETDFSRLLKDKYFRDSLRSSLDDKAVVKIITQEDEKKI